MVEAPIGVEPPDEPSPPRAVTTCLPLPPPFAPSIVVVPPPSGQARPLLVAAHGAGDRPDWQCAMWGRIVAERAFVLCPAGKRWDETTPDDAVGWFYPNHPFLDRELTAAKAALVAAYGPRIDVSRAIYAGFSQGAMMGALVVSQRGGDFSRVILIEGAYPTGRWVAPMAQRFRRQGGERVLFACGGWFCADHARADAIVLGRAGVDAKVVQGRGGHTYGGEVADAVARSFDWVVGDDPRWRER